jgi:hypothetical protein
MPRCHKRPTFYTHLSDKELFVPVDSDTTGEFIAKPIDHVLKYKMLINDIDELTQAHMHLGQPGKPGPIVAFIYGITGPSDQIETLSLTGKITEEDLIGPLADQPLEKLIEEILNGNVFVDIHTREHPTGVARGQLNTR